MPPHRQDTCPRRGDQAPHRAQAAPGPGSSGKAEPVGICNTDPFNMDGPPCRSPVEGTYRYTRADGRVMVEKAMCQDCGEWEVLLHSNDPFGTGDTATFEALQDPGANPKPAGNPDTGRPG